MFSNLLFRCLKKFSVQKAVFRKKTRFFSFSKNNFFQNRNINIFSISRFCFFCFGPHFFLGSKIETEQNFDGFHLTGVVVAVVVDVGDFVVVDVVVVVDK